LGVASLVLGIIGLVFSIMPWTFWLGFPLAILALILGAIGRRSAATNNLPRGKATAGLVLGIVGLGICITYVVVCSLAVSTARKSIEGQLNDPNLNQEFNKAFEKALQDAQKKQEQNK
jgi:SNF family Na+-dependent transporter